MRGERSEELDYTGSAAPLRDVWIAVRASLRAVLEQVTLAEFARGKLPASVEPLARDPDAWAPPLTFRDVSGDSPPPCPKRTCLGTVPGHA